MQIFTPRGQAVDQQTVPTFTANAWTSSIWDGHKYNIVAGCIFADQASSASGFEIQQSHSPTFASTDYTTSYTVSASTALAFTIDLVCRYVRFKFTHGGTEPTVFRLGAWGKVAS